VLGLDGKGNTAVFADYPQWEQWFLSQQTDQRPERGAQAATEKPALPVETVAGSTKKKLSYLEAREFASIEERVEVADARLDAARDRVSDPEVAIDAAKLTEALAEMEAAQAESDTLYARWAELTEKAG
jgi:ATP-binding cassette subfamily F protein uup